VLHSNNNFGGFPWPVGDYRMRKARLPCPQEGLGCWPIGCWSNQLALA